MRAEDIFGMKLKMTSDKKEILCKTCNSLFAQKSPRQLYCCLRCRPCSYKKKMKNVNEKVITCTGCGKLYSRKCNHQKFCTSECRVASRQLPLKTLECIECKEEFVQHSWKQVFCSDECRNANHNKKAFRVPINLSDEQRQQVRDLINSFDLKVSPPRRAE